MWSACIVLFFIILFFPPPLNLPKNCTQGKRGGGGRGRNTFIVNCHMQHHLAWLLWGHHLTNPISLFLSLMGLHKLQNVTKLVSFLRMQMPKNFKKGRPHMKSKGLGFRVYAPSLTSWWEQKLMGLKHFSRYPILEGVFVWIMIMGMGWASL